MKRQIWGGYSRHNQIVKIVKSAEQETEELLVENHAIMMYDPFIEPPKSK
jgi:vancomycin resistance protein VanW